MGEYCLMTGNNTGFFPLRKEQLFTLFGIDNYSAYGFAFLHTVPLCLLIYLIYLHHHDPYNIFGQWIHVQYKD